MRVLLTAADLIVGDDVVGQGRITSIVSDANEVDIEPLVTPKQPCGCPVGEGHRCRPSWVTEDEWERCVCIAGSEHYRADHRRGAS